MRLCFRVRTAVAPQAPPPLIFQAIDEFQLTVFKGNTHPLARLEFDLGDGSGGAAEGAHAAGAEADGRAGNGFAQARSMMSRARCSIWGNLSIPHPCCESAIAQGWAFPSPPREF
jgi:hypothetical protein